MASSAATQLSKANHTETNETWLASVPQDSLDDHFAACGYCLGSFTKTGAWLCCFAAAAGATDII